MFSAVKTKSIARKLTNKFRALNSERRRLSASPSNSSYFCLQQNEKKHQQRKQKQENTFRIEPSDQFNLHLSELHEKIEDMLRDTIGQKRYVKDTCQLICLLLANQIKTLARQMIAAAERHKVLCLVVVNERCNQGISVSSRCLWNETTDNSIHVSYENHSISAVVIVHFVYCE